jgi:hypothetical protein
VKPEIIVPLAKPHFPAYLKVVKQAFTEFDDWMGANRVSVEAARPKVMSCRIAHLLDLEFGRSGSPRFVECGGMQYLVIEDGDTRVGLRFKKGDNNYKTYQHQSEIQDQLREDGLYPWDQAYHAFVTYKIKGGLEPRLHSLAVTFEDKKSVVWCHVFWNEADGLNPPQEVYPPLLPPPSEELPPPPKVRPKRKRSGEDEEAARDDVG